MMCDSGITGQFVKVDDGRYGKITHESVQVGYESTFHIRLINGKFIKAWRSRTNFQVIGWQEYWAAEVMES